MFLAVLTYLDHYPNPNIVCTICLEPVAQKAIKISCHGDLNCSECMGYWMESQIHAKQITSCPRCRTLVDPSNLATPNTSIQWKDVENIENMQWEESEDEAFDDVYEDEDEEGIFRMDDVGEDNEAENGHGQGQATADRSEEHRSHHAGSHGSHASSKENVNLGIPNASSHAVSPAPIVDEASRRDKIAQAALPRHEILELLHAHAGNIPFEIRPDTTYFVPNLSYQTSILICGTHHYYAGGDAHSDDYFFWVHEYTSIGALIALWVGGDMEAEDNIGEAENWYFEGKMLGWRESVAGCGMKNGSRFDIGRPFL